MNLCCTGTRVPVPDYYSTRVRAWVPSYVRAWVPSTIKPELDLRQRRRMAVGPRTRSSRGIEELQNTQNLPSTLFTIAATAHRCASPGPSQVYKPMTRQYWHQRQIQVACFQWHAVILWPTQKLAECQRFIMFKKVMHAHCSFRDGWLHAGNSRTRLDRRLERVKGACPNPRAWAAIEAGERAYTSNPRRGGTCTLNSGHMRHTDLAGRWSSTQETRRS